MATLLDQLKTMTTIVADTGEVQAIKDLKPVDATTNPSLLLKASTLPQCEPMIAEAIAYAKSKSSDKDQQIEDAADKLAVLVGLEILKHIPGRISTEVDASLSFNIDKMVAKGKNIIALSNERFQHTRYSQPLKLNTHARSRRARHASNDLRREASVGHVPYDV